MPFIDYFPYAVDADNPVYQYMHDSESRKRMLYHSHRLGTLFTFVVLDSGLVLPHNGSQTEFLEVRMTLRIASHILSERVATRRQI